jgi:succinyl-CoA synthetase beta subunit
MRAVRTIARLQAQAASIHRSAEAPPDIPAIDAALLRGPDDEIKARRLLRAAGLDVAEEVLVTTAQAAVEAAQRLGCAVALKASSEDIPHKTEVGGVLLNLASAAEVEAGFATITGNIARNAPQARMDGVLVSPMVQGGVEMIVGVVNDAVFGPLVMVGFGGIFVEALRDTAIRIAPFGQDTALEMLHELRGFSLLNGARGSKPADLDALAQAIARVSVLAFRHAHEIASLEINPLLALPDRAVALDGLIVSK